MRRRNQTGASLIIVIGVVGFLSVMVVSMLKLTSAGALVGGVDATERQRTYVVGSALDTAIQEARRAKWMGRYGAVCSTITVPVGSVTATITCSSSTRLADIQRTVHFVAYTGGAKRGSADVVICDGGDLPGVDVCDGAPSSASNPMVVVYNWNVRGG
ncbi:MAG: hypothetical protein ACKOYM_05655 [Actinomycetes bacterium]